MKERGVRAACRTFVAAQRPCFSAPPIGPLCLAFLLSYSFPSAGCFATAKGDVIASRFHNNIHNPLLIATYNPQQARIQDSTTGGARPSFRRRGGPRLPDLKISPKSRVPPYVKTGTSDFEGAWPPWPPPVYGPYP